MHPELRKYALAFVCVVYFSFFIQNVMTQSFGQAELVHEWKWLEIDWASEAEKQEALNTGRFVPERNLLSGVKVYKGQVYISIPRRKWTSGHPVSLAKVNNQSKIVPYPNWEAQKQGDCGALQFVQGMEIDSNTGHMYVIDTGRVGLISNLCPPKIVVYNLNTDQQIALHELPNDVVNWTSNFLNDIVLDYVDGKVRYAYMTDTFAPSIVVYDFQERSAQKLQDPSMNIEDGNATVITINGNDYKFPIAVNGIAMSHDFKYVYYCVLGGYSLFQVPTETLRNPRPTGNTGIRNLGKKVSQTDGMVHGREILYYGAIGLNAVYSWNATADMNTMKVSIDNVKIDTQKQLVRDNDKMQWPSTLALDDEGWLWIACNRLQVFWNAETPPDDGQAYMRIWKIYVNETSYLYQAESRTQESNSGRALMPFMVKSDHNAMLNILFSLIVLNFSYSIAAST